MELSDYKAALAGEMSEKAGLAGHVGFLFGDAVQLIRVLRTGIDFVLVNLWKDLYVPCLEAFYLKLNPGAIMVTDNIRPGRQSAMDNVAAIRTLPDMASFPVPVENGLEISPFKAV